VLADSQDRGDVFRPRVRRQKQGCVQGRGTPRHGNASTGRGGGGSRYAVTLEHPLGRRRVQRVHVKLERRRHLRVRGLRRRRGARREARRGARRGARSGRMGEQRQTRRRRGSRCARCHLRRRAGSEAHYRRSSPRRAAQGSLIGGHGRRGGGRSHLRHRGAAHGGRWGRRSRANVGKSLSQLGPHVHGRALHSRVFVVGRVGPSLVRVVHRMARGRQPCQSRIGRRRGAREDRSRRGVNGDDAPRIPGDPFAAVTQQHLTANLPTDPSRAAVATQGRRDTRVPVVDGGVARPARDARGPRLPLQRASERLVRLCAHKGHAGSAKKTQCLLQVGVPQLPHLGQCRRCVRQGRREPRLRPAQELMGGCGAVHQERVLGEAGHIQQQLRGGRRLVRL